MSQINIKKTQTFAVPPTNMKGYGFDGNGNPVVINENGEASLLSSTMSMTPNTLANLGVGLEADLPEEATIGDVYVSNDSMNVYTRYDEVSWSVEALQTSQFVTTTGAIKQLYQFTGVDLILLASNGSLSVNSLHYNTDITPLDPLPKGTRQWNDHDMTTEVGTGFSNTQDNQEHSWPVINITGTPIPEGRFVRVVSYDNGGLYDCVELSDCSSEATAYVDGMTTCEIPVSVPGLSYEPRLMTVKGKCRGRNTFGATNANPVYLGTQGQPTVTAPIYPNKTVVAGIYSRISAVNGEITVDCSRTFQYKHNEIDAQLLIRQNSFVGICEQCPITETDIVIDTTARTLTIATIKGGETITAANPIRFFVDGDGTVERFEKTSAVTFPAWTDTDGMWYFYFDNTGEPITTQSIWTDFNIVAPIYKIYWNTQLAGTAKLVEEWIEFHQNTISADDHEWKHKQGAIWIRGFDNVSNELTSGAPNADGRNTVLALTSGRVLDDNLPYDVTNTTDVGYFKQDLGNTTAASLNATNSALLPIKVMDGSGRVSLLPATRFPFAWSDQTNRPEWISISGTRTAVTNNYFFKYFCYALQDRKNGQSIKLVCAPLEFATIDEAKAYSWESVRALYPTLQDNEVRPLWERVYEYKSSYSSGCKYSVMRWKADIRTQKTTTSSTASGSVLASNVITTNRSIIQGSSIDSQMQYVNDNYTKGASSSTAKRIPVFADTSGKLLEDSGASIDAGVLVLDKRIEQGTDSEEYTGNTPSITITNKYKKFNKVTSGTGDGTISFTNYPTTNTEHLMVIGNTRGTDLTIVFPTADITDSGITYTFFKAVDSIVVKDGFKAEVSFSYDVISASVIHVNILATALNTKSS